MRAGEEYPAAYEYLWQQCVDLIDTAIDPGDAYCAALAWRAAAPVHARDRRYVWRVDSVDGFNWRNVCAVARVGVHMRYCDKMYTLNAFWEQRAHRPYIMHGAECGIMPSWIWFKFRAGVATVAAQYTLLVSAMTADAARHYVCAILRHIATLRGATTRAAVTWLFSRFADDFPSGCVIKDDPRYTIAFFTMLTPSSPIVMTPRLFSLFARSGIRDGAGVPLVRCLRRGFFHVSADTPPVHISTPVRKYTSDLGRASRAVPWTPTRHADYPLEFRSATRTLMMVFARNHLLRVPGVGRSRDMEHAVVAAVAQHYCVHDDIDRAYMDRAAFLLSRLYTTSQVFNYLREHRIRGNIRAAEYPYRLCLAAVNARLYSHARVMTYRAHLARVHAAARAEFGTLSGAIQYGREIYHAQIPRADTDHALEYLAIAMIFNMGQAPPAVTSRRPRVRLKHWREKIGSDDYTTGYL